MIMMKCTYKKGSNQSNGCSCSRLVIFNQKKKGHSAEIQHAFPQSMESITLKRMS